MSEGISSNFNRSASTPPRTGHSRSNTLPCPSSLLLTSRMRDKLSRWNSSGINDEDMQNSRRSPAVKRVHELVKFGRTRSPDLRSTSPTLFPTIGTVPDSPPASISKISEKYNEKMGVVLERFSSIAREEAEQRAIEEYLQAKARTELPSLDGEKARPEREKPRLKFMEFQQEQRDNPMRALPPAFITVERNMRLYTSSDVERDRLRQRAEARIEERKKQFEESATADYPHANKEAVFRESKSPVKLRKLRQRAKEEAKHEEEVLQRARQYQEEQYKYKLVLASKVSRQEAERARAMKAEENAKKALRWSLLVTHATRVLVFMRARQAIVRFRETFALAIIAAIRLQRNWRKYVEKKKRTERMEEWKRMIRTMRWFMLRCRIRRKTRAVELIKKVLVALGGVSQVPRFIALYRNSVIAAQRIAKNFVSCRHARLRNLRLQWVVTEEDHHAREVEAEARRVQRLAELQAQVKGGQRKLANLQQLAASMTTSPTRSPTRSPTMSPVRDRKKSFFGSAALESPAKPSGLGARKGTVAMLRQGTRGDLSRSDSKAAAEFSDWTPVPKSIRNQLLEEHLRHCRREMQVALGEYLELLAGWRQRSKTHSVMEDARRNLMESYGRQIAPIPFAEPPPVRPILHYHLKRYQMWDLVEEGIKLQQEENKKLLGELLEAELQQKRQEVETVHSSRSGAMSSFFLTENGSDFGDEVDELDEDELQEEAED